MNGDFSELLNLARNGAEREWLRKRLETLSTKERVTLTAALLWETPKTEEDAVNLALNADRCEVYCSVTNYGDLGRRYLSDKGAPLPNNPEEFVDMEALGRLCRRYVPGEFVDGCYVRRPGRSLLEPRSGNNPGLPEDRWDIRVRLASEACPEGVWVRFPDYCYYMPEVDAPNEIEIALWRLGVGNPEECRVLDVRCNVPGMGDIAAQYDRVENLLYDANSLGFILEERAGSEPGFKEKFAAALEYENCETLGEALEIEDNLYHYRTVRTESLRDVAKKELEKGNFPQSLCFAIDMEAYGERLLLDDGYCKSRDGTLFVGRADRLKERDAPQPTREKRKKAQPTR